MGIEWKVRLLEGWDDPRRDPEVGRDRQEVGRDGGLSRDALRAADRRRAAARGADRRAGRRRRLGAGHRDAALVAA